MMCCLQTSTSAIQHLASTMLPARMRSTCTRVTARLATVASTVNVSPTCRQVSICRFLSNTPCNKSTDTCTSALCTYVLSFDISHLIIYWSTVNVTSGHVDYSSMQKITEKPEYKHRYRWSILRVVDSKATTAQYETYICLFRYMRHELTRMQ